MCAWSAAVVVVVAVEITAGQAELVARHHLAH
jgi:hypothetical protein